jgi:hypothetical protein
MNEILELLTKYGVAFSAIGAAFAFAWSIIQFFSIRMREARFREFETFHKLIKELTEMQHTNNYRQIAVLFELRFYPRYYPITLRILKSTRKHAGGLTNTSTEMIEEVNCLITFIERRSNTMSQRIAKKLCFFAMR